MGLGTEQCRFSEAITTMIIESLQLVRCQNSFSFRKYVILGHSRRNEKVLFTWLYMLWQFHVVDHHLCVLGRGGTIFHLHLLTKLLNVN